MKKYKKINLPQTLDLILFVLASGGPYGYRPRGRPLSQPDYPEYDQRVPGVCLMKIMSGTHNTLPLNITLCD